MDVNQIFFIGHNKYGQAGIGEEQHNKRYSKPREIVFKTFIKQVSCGNHHSALLTIDGLLYTMGSNIHGTLGLGNTGNINYAFKPTLVKELIDVDQVFSGSFHMSALKQGQLYTWGKGIDGQLGHGNMKNIFVPTKVQALGNDVQLVSCGLNHTLVIVNKNKNSLNGYAFGSGIYGQLGCGSNKNFNYPVNIKLQNIQSISAGQNHTLLISNNQIYGCGDNGYFQLDKFQDSNKNKKYILEPQKLPFFQKQKINLIDCHNISVAVNDQNKAYLWGGKCKIWPPIQINQREILNIKVNNQKIYYLSSENQIVTVTFQPKGQGFSEVKQILISNKNIMDFDCGQNHFLAVGDIVAQTQQKNSPQILSIWSDQSLNLSRQTFSQKNIISSHKQSQEYYQEPQQKRQFQNYFITKHLNSGNSFQSNSKEKQQIALEKQSISQFSNSQNKPYQNSIFTEQTFHNTSSSIEVEQKRAIHPNDSETKKYLQDRNFVKIKDFNHIKPSENLRMNNVLILNQALENKGPQNKLQKLMADMQQKTMHLKRNYEIEQQNNSALDSSSADKNMLEQSIRQRKIIQKTPSSYIKKQPQRFIIESQQGKQNRNLFIEPKISTFQQKINVTLPLRQITINNNNMVNKKQSQHKLQKITKSIVYYNDKQNFASEQTNKSGCFKQIHQFEASQEKNIQTIFRQLLRKHHKQKTLNQKKSQNSLQKYKDASKQKINALSHSHSCISSNPTQNSTSRLYKQSIEMPQMKKSTNIRISPQKQNRMTVSKISTHSNVSAKSNFKKNSDILQISRSNRELRYELRDRDLKIGQLQFDLSKKQMEVQMLYQKLQQYKSLSSCCHQCGSKNSFADSFSQF